jgi:uroporphyrinogen-III decarboxylase
MPVAKDLVEAGLDCIGPLDPLGGFTCEQMRQKVGQRVSLMGGVDTSSFVNATPEELMDEAKRCIQAAGREGGYVLGSGCVIPRSAKRENLEALVEAARLHGSYEGGKLRCL